MQDLPALSGELAWFICRGAAVLRKKMKYIRSEENIWLLTDPQVKWPAKKERNNHAQQTYGLFSTNCILNITVIPHSD
jgi:hypothetical protein